MTDHKMVTVNEAARISGLALLTIYKKLADRKVPGSYKVAGQWLIPRTWAEERRKERKILQAAGKSA